VRVALVPLSPFPRRRFLSPSGAPHASLIAFRRRVSPRVLLCKSQRARGGLAPPTFEARIAFNASALVLLPIPVHRSLKEICDDRDGLFGEF